MSPSLKSTNLYGPVPTGLRLAGVTRLGADKVAEQMFRNQHAAGADEGSAQNGVGFEYVTSTVCESIFLTTTLL